MKKIIKKILKLFGLEVKKYNHKSNISKIISLKPDVPCLGDVLLSYIIEPFLLKNGESISNAHTHDWESFQIANTFLEFGYSVDIIDYRDKVFLPVKNYHFFISARTNFEKIAKHLNNSCKKIVHLDTSHWLFNNTAALGRCLDLQRRRGITMESIKRVEPNWAIEYADYATVLGNDFTINTYRYAKKPIYRIPISTCGQYPWNENKNFEAAKKNYLWLGSSGLVHKGLDLVVEAFAKMPDYNLFICGPILQNDVFWQDKDFEREYFKELHQTSNIHTIGWIDVNSSSFKELTNKCIGIIYPSCAEGGGGSVINCMHAGLIPIVSYESSVDVGDFGIILKTNTIAEIQNTIKMVSAFPHDKLKHMSRCTWDFVRKNHTREKFAKEYKKFVTLVSNNLSEGLNAEGFE